MASVGSRLSGRRIVVTGAASGIGKQTALLFAREGAKVLLFDQAADRLAPVAGETGGQPFVVDIRDSTAVNEAVAKAAEIGGGIDGLVNAAGIIIRGGIDDTTDEIWAKVLEVNLFGTFYLCRAALPYLRKQPNATIVNISSGAAVVPSSGAPSYAASKGGVLGLSKALAMNEGPRVRVNAIAPGLVDTPLIQPNPGDPPRAAGGEQRYALKRIGKPEEIADAILFLTGPESALITGITLAVDGGRTYH
jgi:NAD(P)-dependent dehydrogenase (short-subunit alcohol dehydrogenase family)